MARSTERLCQGIRVSPRAKSENVETQIWRGRSGRFPILDVLDVEAVTFSDTVVVRKRKRKALLYHVAVVFALFVEPVPHFPGGSSKPNHVGQKFALSATGGGR